MKKRVIFFISVFLDYVPWLRRAKNKLVVFYYFLIYRLKQRSNDQFQNMQLIEVSRVSDISFAEFNLVENLGDVKGGDWDKNRTTFEDIDVYKAFHEHFFSGKKWSDSEYYKRVVDAVEGGEIKWGCKTKEQVYIRFSSFDDLFERIKQDGFLSAKALIDKGASMPFYDDVMLCIDRHGVYIIRDGRHRFSIAKLLELEMIPVRIAARHKEWVKFCDEVRAYIMHNTCLYAPVTHPDLADLPATYGDERIEYIKDNLPFEEGDVLDIGSHWGYFCHHLEAEGFICYAMEPDDRNLYFMNKLKRAENRKFSVIPCGVFDYKGKMSFDIVLALYIFHHFLKVEEHYFKLINFLKALDAKAIFFSTHTHDEPQMKGAYKNMQPEEFADFVLEHSGLTSKKCLWTDEAGRKLYLLQ